MIIAAGCGSQDESRTRNFSIDACYEPSMKEWRIAKITELRDDLETLEKVLADAGVAVLDEEKRLVSVRNTVPPSLLRALEEFDAIERKFLEVERNLKAAESAYMKDKTSEKMAILADADYWYNWFKIDYEYLRDRMWDRLLDRKIELDGANERYNSYVRKFNELAATRDLIREQHNAVVNMKDCPVILRAGDAEEFTNNVISSVSTSTVPAGPMVFQFFDEPLTPEMEGSLEQYSAAPEPDVTTTTTIEPSSSSTSVQNSPSSTETTTGGELENAADTSPESGDTESVETSTTSIPLPSSTETSAVQSPSTTVSDEEIFVVIPEEEPVGVPEAAPVSEEQVLEQARGELAETSASSTTTSTVNSPPATVPLAEIATEIAQAVEDLLDNGVPEMPESLDFDAPLALAKVVSGGEPAQAPSQVEVAVSGFAPSAPVVIADSAGEVIAAVDTDDRGRVSTTVEVTSSGAQPVILVAGKTSSGDVQVVPVAVQSNVNSPDATPVEETDQATTTTVGSGEDVDESTVDSDADSQPTGLWWWLVVALLAILAAWRVLTKRRGTRAD
jgi:hypothetical protein